MTKYDRRQITVRSHYWINVVMLCGNKGGSVGGRPPSSATSCSCILFELSGAHAGKRRCVTDLRSLFPPAVHHCQSHSTNQTQVSTLGLQQPAFLKINRSASAFRCTQTSCTAPLLLLCDPPPSFTGVRLVPHHLRCCSAASCCSPSSRDQLTCPVLVCQHR